MNRTSYRLGDICNLVKGTSATLKTEPGPFPLVVTASYRRSSDTFQMEGPAVCIPLVSSTGHGDAAIHRVHYQDGKFALANLMVALLPKDQKVCDAHYLYHLLMVLKDSVLVPLMQGTANVSLKERDIAGVEVDLPPLAEQRRIVAKVESLAAKIAEARRLRGICAAAGAALISSETARVFEEVARRFPSKMFGDFSPHVTSGPRSWAARYVDKGLRFYRAQDIGPNGDILQTSKVFIEPPSTNQGQTAKIQVGDLMLVITGATVGRCSRFDDAMEPGFVSQHVAICRLPADRVDSRYALWVLRSPLGQAQLLGQRYGRVSRGST